MHSCNTIFILGKNKVQWRTSQNDPTGTSSNHLYDLWTWRFCWAKLCSQIKLFFLLSQIYLFYRYSHCRYSGFVSTKSYVALGSLIIVLLTCFIFLSVDIDKPLVSIMYSMNLYISEGSKKNVCCKVDSNPAPVSTRLVNGSKDIFVKHNVQNICYQIDKVSRYDQGNYTCIAENEIGSSSTTIFLKVKCKSNID